jgi:hypothetical protein
LTFDNINESGVEKIPLNRSLEAEKTKRPVPKKPNEAKDIYAQIDDHRKNLAETTVEKQVINSQGSFADNLERMKQFTAVTKSPNSHGLKNSSGSDRKS